MEGKRVSYILVTVFFPKFHLKFTLTNSVTNINKLDSNAHLGLFSNGWIRFKVRSKYQCFKKWKHRGTHGARAITPTRVLIHFYKFTDRWIKFKWFSFFKTCTSWFLLEFYDFRFVLTFILKKNNFCLFRKHIYLFNFKLCLYIVWFLFVLHYCPIQQWQARIAVLYIYQFQKQHDFIFKWYIDIRKR